MICPECHGNGYWIDQIRVLRQIRPCDIRQCDTCDSRGEIDDSASAAKAADD